MMYDIRQTGFTTNGGTVLPGQVSVSFEKLGGKSRSSYFGKIIVCELKYRHQNVQKFRFIHKSVNSEGRCPQAWYTESTTQVSLVNKMNEHHSFTQPGRAGCHANTGLPSSNKTGLFT